MKIAVLIKQVPDMEKVRFDREKGVVDRSSADVEINPFDLNALEAGVQAGETTGAPVTAITMGPPRGEEALKEAIARGAQEGILLSDRAFGGADTRATAKTLAAALKKMGEADLIFAGEKTVDGDTGQVGAEVAEYLNIPHISYVDEIVEISEDFITVVSDIMEGRYLKKAKFPVLLTVTKDLNVPRLPTFKSKMSARKAEIPVWSMKELSDVLTEEEAGLKGSPTKVKKIEVPKLAQRSCKKGKEDVNGFLDQMILELQEKNVLEG